MKVIICVGYIEVNDKGCLRLEIFGFGGFGSFVVILLF